MKEDTNKQTNKNPWGGEGGPGTKQKESNG